MCVYDVKMQDTIFMWLLYVISTISAAKGAHHLFHLTNLSLPLETSGGRGLHHTGEADVHILPA